MDKEFVTVIVAIALAVFLSAASLVVAVHTNNQIKEITDHKNTQQIPKSSNEFYPASKEFLEDVYLNLYGGGYSEDDTRELIRSFKEIYPEASPSEIGTKIEIAKARKQVNDLQKKSELLKINPEDYNSPMSCKKIGETVNPEDYNTP